MMDKQTQAKVILILVQMAKQGEPPHIFLDSKPEFITLEDLATLRTTIALYIANLEDADPSDDINRLIVMPYMIEMHQLLLDLT